MLIRLLEVDVYDEEELMEGERDFSILLCMWGCSEDNISGYKASSAVLHISYILK